MTTYLKFADEAEFLIAMAPYMAKDMQGEPQLPSYIVLPGTHATADEAVAAVDVIGTIYLPTGNYIEGEGGMRYPEMAPIPGWHVNLSGNTVPAGLEAFTIPAPAQPVRVFA